MWGGEAGLRNANMTVRQYPLRVYAIGMDLAEQKTGIVSTMSAAGQNTIVVDGTW